MDERVVLDEVDHRILTELERDGRMSIRTLAERVHVSRANAYTRLSRLLDGGVIQGFGARVDPERAGLGTSVYVTAKIQQNSWREFRRHVARLPEVRHVALVGADFDVVLLVRTTDNAALRELVLDRLQEIPGVLSTNTWIIFDELTQPGLHAPG